MKELTTPGTAAGFRIWRPMAASLLTVGLLVACVGNGAPEGEPMVRADAGGVRLAGWVDPDPPKQEASLWLQIADGDGAAIAGAEVNVGWLMPAMGAMQEMKGTATVAEVEPGLYRAALDLPMAGSWSLPISVHTGSRRASFDLSLNVGTPGLRLVGAHATGAAGGAATSTRAASPIGEIDYPPAVAGALRAVLAAYDSIRGLLSTDSDAGLVPAARQIVARLEAAEGDDGFAALPDAVRARFGEAANAARDLAAAADLAAARSAFGELSRPLIALAGADKRLVDGWQVYSCPMTATYPRWMQPGDKANPYMGAAMPSCGAVDDWADGEAAAATTAAADAWAPMPGLTAEGMKMEGMDMSANVPGASGDEIAYYTCSMHPSVKKEETGTCPICSMDLVPVTQEEVATGTFVVDPRRRQEIGVRTARAAVTPVSMTVRAVGKVAIDESRLAEVTLKVGGFVGPVRVDRTGQSVRRGATLFELYSPELYATQEELLAALASQRAARDTAAPQRADYLVEAARQRLRLWDLDDAEIDRIAASGKPIEYLPVVAPASGVVLEKNIVQGSSVRSGDVLYRIAGLDRVWVEADLYESELALVAVGQRARVTLSYLPGEVFTGRVSFIYPYLDAGSRTTRLRVELANPNGALKPDMYANVELQVERGERLTVPEEAVLYAGERRLVFVDLGAGRLQPRTIETGLRTGERVEVLKGLEPGELVVTSGNFLIAAESRLKSATGQWQ